MFAVSSKSRGKKHGSRRTKHHRKRNTDPIHSRAKWKTSLMCPRVLELLRQQQMPSVTLYSQKKKQIVPPLFLIKGLHMTTEWWCAVGQPTRCHGNSGLKRGECERSLMNTEPCLLETVNPRRKHLFPDRVRCDAKSEQRQVHFSVLISQVMDSHRGI